MLHIKHSRACWMEPRVKQLTSFHSYCSLKINNNASIYFLSINYWGKVRIIQVIRAINQYYNLIWLFNLLLYSRQVSENIFSHLFDIVIVYLERRVEKSIIVHFEVGNKCSLLGLILYTWYVTHPHTSTLCHWKDTEMTWPKYCLFYKIKQLTLLVTYVVISMLMSSE